MCSLCAVLVVCFLAAASFQRSIHDTLRDLTFRSVLFARWQTVNRLLLRPSKDKYYSSRCVGASSIRAPSQARSRRKEKTEPRAPTGAVFSDLNERQKAGLFHRSVICRG
jgi:hypothetical protein